LANEGKHDGLDEDDLGKDHVRLKVFIKLSIWVELTSTGTGGEILLFMK